MGRVKAMMMEQEEKFQYEAVNIIGECETWHEFTSRMESHMHLVEMHSLSETMDLMSEMWAEYWSEYKDAD